MPVPITGAALAKLLTNPMIASALLSGGMALLDSRKDQDSAAESLGEVGTSAALGALTGALGGKIGQRFVGKIPGQNVLSKTARATIPALSGLATAYTADKLLRGPTRGLGNLGGDALNKMLPGNQETDVFNPASSATGMQEGVVTDPYAAVRQGDQYADRRFGVGLDQSRRQQEMQLGLLDKGDRQAAQRAAYQMDMLFPRQERIAEANYARGSRAANEKSLLADRSVGNQGMWNIIGQTPGLMHNSLHTALQASNPYF